MVIASLCVLLAVFAVRAIIWWWLLRQIDAGFPYQVAVYSAFKPLLVRYLPGKIWMLMGTAAILNERLDNVPLSTGITGLYQVIMIAAAFVLILPALTLPLSKGLGLDSLTVLITLVAMLCVSLVIINLKKLIGAIPKLQKPFSFLDYMPNNRTLILLLVFCSCHWLMLGAAYVLFFYGAAEIFIPSGIILQPLANTGGILAPFAPGGLGIREGLTAGYLSFTISADSALVLALQSRIWFLVAEIFAFCFAYLFQQK